MSLLRQLSVLAVCQVLGDRADSLMGFVGERVRDNASRLENALGRANDRAWSCLEVALAGESFWSFLTSRDERNLQKQIRQFLSSLPQTELPGDAKAFRKRAAAELTSARNAGIVPGGHVAAADLAQDHARVFARYGDPQGFLERDRRLLNGVAAMLAKAGYTNLAHYVGLRPSGGQPLLAQAVCYFFRREVENDAKLAAGLTMEKLDGLDRGLRSGLDGLREALDDRGEELGAMLAATQAGVAEVSKKVSATMEVVTGTRDDVQSLRAQMEQQRQQLHQMMGLMEQMLKGQQAAPAQAQPEVEKKVRKPEAPATSEAKSGFFALASGLDQGANDWAQVQQLLAQVQRISPEEQRSRPELSRMVDQVTEAVQRMETTRRTILHLEQAETGQDPIPALPVEPAKEKRRASGRPASPLFQRAWDQANKRGGDAEKS